MQMKLILFFVALAITSVSLVTCLDATLNCTNAELNMRTIELLGTSPVQISSLNLTEYNYPSYIQQVCGTNYSFLQIKSKTGTKQQPLVMLRLDSTETTSAESDEAAEEDESSEGSSSITSLDLRRLISFDILLIENYMSTDESEMRAHCQDTMLPYFNRETFPKDDVGDDDASRDDYLLRMKWWYINVVSPIMNYTCEI